MTGPHIELPQGTLDLLILRTLALGRRHGWAISERIQQMSGGLIKAHWGTSENNGRAKYYELSRNGHQQLEVEKDAWAKLTSAVAQVLGTA